MKNIKLNQMFDKQNAKIGVDYNFDKRKMKKNKM